jgi:translation initiation factor IF-1
MRTISVLSRQMTTEFQCEDENAEKTSSAKISGSGKKIRIKPGICSIEQRTEM